MQKIRCNICGIAEENWINGKCHGPLHCICDMTPEVILDDARIYNWAAKSIGPKAFIDGIMLNPDALIELARQKIDAGEKVPQYIRDFIERGVAQHAKSL